MININFDLQNISQTSTFQGCYDALKAEIDSYSTPVIGVGITILVIEVRISVIRPSICKIVPGIFIVFHFMYLYCYIQRTLHEYKALKIMFNEFALSYGLIFNR